MKEIEILVSPNLELIKGKWVFRFLLSNTSSILHALYTAGPRNRQRSPIRFDAGSGIRDAAARLPLCNLCAVIKVNFDLHFPCGEGSESELFSVFSTDSLSLSPAILLHEYTHAFINPLTEKYRSLVCAFQSAYQWLSKYKLPDYQSGYGDWEECVNEHLVRAMTIHLLHRCGYSDLAQKMLRNDLYCGYQYIPLLLERYCIYDANRGTYSDFEHYYPELLQVFSAPPEQGSVLRSIDKTKK